MWSISFSATTNGALDKMKFSPLFVNTSFKVGQQSVLLHVGQTKVIPRSRAHRSGDEFCLKKKRD